MRISTSIKKRLFSGLKGKNSYDKLEYFDLHLA
jgi:hypothetical protein